MDTCHYCNIACHYCNIDKLLCLQKKKSVYDIAKSYSPTIHKMLLNVMSHSLHFLNYFCMYAWPQLPKKESKGADRGSCDEGEGKDNDQPASVTRQDKDLSIVSSYTLMLVLSQNEIVLYSHRCLHTAKPMRGIQEYSSLTFHGNKQLHQMVHTSLSGDRR